MTEHCGKCGSEMCNHGCCPECEEQCHHCSGGDRNNKFFGYVDSSPKTFDIEGIDFCSIHRTRTSYCGCDKSTER